MGTIKGRCGCFNDSAYWIITASLEGFVNRDVEIKDFCSNCSCIAITVLVLFLSHSGGGRHRVVQS